MKTYTLREKVKDVAVASRVAVIVIQMVANLMLPDHQADAFVSPEDPELPVSLADQVVRWVLGGFVRWDAHYFMHIAQYGYTHENTLAFFPLFPLLVRCVAAVIGVPLLYFLNYYSVLLISAVLVNFVLFVRTAIVFHKLSEHVLRDETLAYHASLLFCINPASVFFSAPYSEGLFAFLTFSALLFNETRSSSSLGAGMFGLASSARSNGLVNVGFVLYRKLQDCSNYFYRIRNATTESGQLSLVLVLLLTVNYTLIPLFLGCFAVVLPFAVFQIWCYMTYCKEEGKAPMLPPHLEMFVRANFLHSPDLGEAEWCFNFPPLAYSHVQDKYWDVGFLRYYEFRQVPNFMLALPMVMMVICHAALYMVDNPQICWGLGIPVSASEHSTGEKDKQPLPWPEKGINSWRVFIYTAHSLCLCAFCVLCIHVQVTTRLLCSSCPVVYWFAAHLLSDTSKPKVGREKATSSPETQANLTKRYKVALFSECPKSFWGQVVLSYFILYFVMGVVLYSNFLPWT